MRKIALLLPIALGGALCPAQQPVADTPKAPSAPTLWNMPYEINGQVTYISQNLFPFRSPYSGQLSLPSRSETEWTQTYTAYLGLRPLHNFDLYVDPEWSLGNGIGSGLAAFPNGDVLRVPVGNAAGASQVPYFARAFARWTVATGHGETEVKQDQNQIAGEQPVDRLVITAGKLAAPDIFDSNSYANNTRSQFMNWVLINNGAWDYAADLRGYTSGAAIEWVHSTWTLRAGSFSMPTIANGPALGSIFAQQRGDQVELEEHAKALRHKDAAVIRLMAYRNVADMGSYSQAISDGKATKTTPNIVGTRQLDTVKYGFGLNMEQALGDDGDTGAFARLGWDDGATESFAYTECDSTVNGGLQVSGKRWKMPQDRAALAVAVDGLSTSHREYLADGGLGFLLGDGKLNYGQEQLLEVYYAHQFPLNLQGTIDFQLIKNPGYNQDRGPVPVVSFRLHWQF